MKFEELLAKKAKPLGTIMDSFRDYVEEILQKNKPQTNLLIAKAREKQWVSVDDLKEFSLAKEDLVRKLVERIERIFKTHRCLDCGVVNPDGSHVIKTYIMVPVEAWEDLKKEVLE